MARTCETLQIGLPVRNGEAFLAEALRSILDQTFGDFQLLISDNACTDRTGEICRHFAGLDPRVRYSRNPVDLGAAANFNLVFARSTSRFFKWAAHDDVLEPRFLERCLEVLDSDPSTVLAYSKIRRIDAAGEVTGTCDIARRFDAGRPHQRWAALIRRHPCVSVFGVVRSEALRRTRGLGPYVASDLCLLAELGLAGKIFEIPEYLFRRRDHPDTSCRKMADPTERIAWFDPRRQGRIVLPEWRLAWEYAKTVFRVPLPAGERVRCLAHLARFCSERRRWLVMNVLAAARAATDRVPLARNLVSAGLAAGRRVGLRPWAIVRGVDPL